MLLFRASVAGDWLDKVVSGVSTLLPDHAHPERRAATTAPTLERHPLLRDRVEELDDIEELEHFRRVMTLVRRRGVPCGPTTRSPRISGPMRFIRSGAHGQVIDHLICCSLIKGRSCEKFRFLAEGFRASDPELADFHAGPVESEGNHHAACLLMARAVDEEETGRRLDDLPDEDARLMAIPDPHAMLH